MKPQYWESVYLLFALACSTAVTKEVSLDLEGKNCNEYKYGPMKIGDNDVISLNWDQDMDEQCSLSFGPKKKDVMDLYKVCIRVEKFVVSCDVSLTFYQDGSDEEKVYSCKDNPSHWCGRTDSTVYLKVKVKTDLLNFISSIGRDSAIKLELTTEKIYTTEETKKLAVYIGIGAAAVGFLIVVGIFIGCIVHNVRHKRKKRHDRRRRPSDPNVNANSPTVQEENLDNSRRLVPAAPPDIDIHLEPGDYRPGLNEDMSDLPPPSYEEVMALEESSGEYIK